MNYDFRPGDLVANGEYELLDKLGAGGFGFVWRARNLPLNSVVALKFFSRAFAGKGIDELVNEEGRRMAALSRSDRAGARHIVAVFRSVVGSAQHPPFLELEFMEGGSLRRRLDKEGPLAPREAVALATQMALAVRCAHEHELLHRDIKPDNILLGASPSLYKLGDFGLAGRLSEFTSTPVGTPKYMSPEQFGGGTAVGPASDLYSLGLVLHECVSGRPAFSADPALDPKAAWQAYADQHRNQRPPTPHNHLYLNAEGEALVQLIQRCLAKEPAARPSAEEFLEGLRRLGGEASASGYGPEISKLRRRRQVDANGLPFTRVRHEDTGLEFEEVGAGGLGKLGYWWPTRLVRQIDFLRFIRDPASPRGARWSPQTASLEAHDGGYLASWFQGHPSRHLEQEPLDCVPFAAAADFTDWLGCALPPVDTLEKALGAGMELPVVAQLRDYQQRKGLSYLLLWCSDPGAPGERLLYRFGLRAGALGDRLLRVSRPAHYCFPHILFLPLLPETIANNLPEGEIAAQPSVSAGAGDDRAGVTRVGPLAPAAADVTLPPGSEGL